jgi:hypothetical protein
MAREILRARGDEDDLGAQWHHSFLSRQSELRDKIVRKNMVHRSDQYPVIVRDWFELFRSTTMKYKIHRDDIYNVDVRFMTLSNPGTAPVMVSRHEKHGWPCYFLSHWTVEYRAWSRVVERSFRLLLIENSWRFGKPPLDHRWIWITNFYPGNPVLPRPQDHRAMLPSSYYSNTTTVCTSTT